MALTLAQQVILKADIEADPVLGLLPASAQSAFDIAAAYQVEIPAWIVWKTAVTKDAIMQNGFDWTRLDNLSVGKARIWTEIFSNANTAINPAKPNQRAGIDAVWVGTQADLNVRAAVYVHCKRSANRLEKLLSSGTGTDASPATMMVEGVISYNEVGAAMGWSF